MGASVLVQALRPIVSWRVRVKDRHRDRLVRHVHLPIPALRPQRAAEPEAGLQVGRAEKHRWIRRSCAR